MKKERKVTLKKLQFGQDDKAQDYAFWDELGDEAKFTAAWDLVVQAWEIQGKDPNELRLNRSIAKFHRFPG